MNRREDKVLIVDLHIKALNPEGHFYERAACLAQVIASSTGIRPGLCCALEAEEDRQEIFTKIISTPGFNSFSFPSPARAAKRLICDEPWLTLAEEYLSQSHLPLNTKPYTKRPDGSMENLTPEVMRAFLDREVLSYFRINARRLYCADPESTVTACKLIASFYNPLGKQAINSTSINKIRSSIDSIITLRLRDSMENHALHRASSERIVQMAIREGFNNIIFNTASPEDALGAITQATEQEARETGRGKIRLSFLFHQPTAFDDERTCYSLHRLQNYKPNIGNYISTRFYASCEEFRVHLSSHRFCSIGKKFGIICGPFNEKPPGTKNAHNDSNTKLRKAATGLALATKALTRDASWKSHTLKSLAKAGNNAIPEYLTTRIRQSNRDMHGIPSQIISMVNSIGALQSLAFLGDIRDEKRFADFLRISRDLSQDAKRKAPVIIRPSFFSSGEISASKKALEEHLRENTPPKDISYDLLSDQDYFWLLHNSSCIYAAYDRGAYGVKQSGIFYESLLSYKPTILNIGTSSSHSLGRLCRKTLFAAHGDRMNRIHFAQQAGPRPVLVSIPETDGTTGLDIIVSITASDGNNAAAGSSIHCYFVVSLICGPPEKIDQCQILSKKLEFRGLSVSCAFSRVEILYLQERLRGENQLSVKIEHVIGLKPGDTYTTSVDISLCRASESGANLFAKHAIIDLDEDSTNQIQIISINRDCWWDHAEPTEGTNKIAERIRKILDKDTLSILEDSTV